MTTTAIVEQRCEQRIHEYVCTSELPMTRREAAHRLMSALAEVIADDVVMGEEQWQPRLEEYAYLRKLVADLYGEPAPFTREGES